MTERKANTIDVAQFAQLLVNLQPLLQKVTDEGLEMPPLEELLHFAQQAPKGFFFFACSALQH